MDEGSSGYIRCKVEGDPLPTIQWRGRQQDWISGYDYNPIEHPFYRK